MEAECLFHVSFILVNQSDIFKLVGRSLEIPDFFINGKGLFIVVKGLIQISLNSVDQSSVAELVCDSPRVVNFFVNIQRLLIITEGFT